MGGINRCLLSLLVLVFTLLQTGCATPQQEQFYRGIYMVEMDTDAKPLADYLADYPELGSLSDRHLYYACFAYFQVRNYAAFDSCSSLFLAKTQPDQPWQPFALHVHRSWYGFDVAEFSGTRAEARAMMLSWRSLMRLDLEDLDGALSDIEEAVVLIEQERESPTVESSFLFSPFRYPLRFITVEVYRAYGIIQARAQNTEAAQRALTAIREQSVVMRESDLRKFKNPYAAHVHMALNDFPAARADLEVYDGMSVEQTLLAGVLFALSAGGGDLFSTLQAAGGGVSTLVPGEDPFLSKFLLAKISFETGDIENSEAAYQLLLADEAIEQYPNLHFVVLHDLSRIMSANNNSDQVIALLKQSVEVIEARRRTINSEGSKIGFVGNKQAIYHDLITALIEQGRHAEAFAYVERSKARALVDMLASKRDFASKSLERVDIAALLSQIEALEQQPSSQAAEGKRGLKAIRQRVQQADSEIASLTTVKALGADEVGKILARDEVLVEYYGHGDELFAFVVDRSGVDAVTLDGHGLDDDVSQFRRWLQAPVTNVDSTSQPAERLYRRLITPLKPHLNAANLTVVPHGRLHYIPFSALQDDGEYLLQDYRLRVLPSASVMEFLSDTPRGKSGTALVFGNPDLDDRNLDLPYAELEARKIGALVPGATVLLRNQATETNARQLGSAYRYIHFASHGVFSPEAPLSSALLLRADAANDGRLTVAELYDMRMDADLITLSACETALGKVANGDDVVGFTRGFLYAGANSIVSSLWQVDDEATAMLMQRFYSNLSTMDKRAALRSAQLDMLSSTKKHPYYWSAFQLTGSVD